jgi:hypothetical protein
VGIPVPEHVTLRTLATREGERTVLELSRSRDSTYDSVISDIMSSGTCGMAL